MIGARVTEGAPPRDASEAFSSSARARDFELRHEALAPPRGRQDFDDWPRRARPRRSCQGRPGGQRAVFCRTSCLLDGASGDRHWSMARTKNGTTRSMLRPPAGAKNLSIWSLVMFALAACSDSSSPVAAGGGGQDAGAGGAMVGGSGGATNGPGGGTAGAETGGGG